MSKTTEIYIKFMAYCLENKVSSETLCKTWILIINLAYEEKAYIQTRILANCGGRWKDFCTQIALEYSEALLKESRDNLEVLFATS